MTMIRVLGLLPWIARVWSQVRAEPIATWTRDKAGLWYQNSQGSSALLAACERACFLDESAKD